MPPRFRALLADRGRGAVAVKSVLAYRAGFDVDLSRPSDAEVARHVAAWLREVGRTETVRLTDPRLMAFGIQRRSSWACRSSCTSGSATATWTCGAPTRCCSLASSGCPRWRGSR